MPLVQCLAVLIYTMFVSSDRSSNALLIPPLFSYYCTDPLVEIGADNRSTLFAATRVLQAKRGPPLPHMLPEHQPAPGAPAGTPAKHRRPPVLAMVVRTSFATVKGALILSILWYVVGCVL